jgi:TRAP transporter 4TM/12TM fusion protein
MGANLQAVVTACAVVLPIFVLVEVNYPHLTPQSQLALFALMGFVFIYLGGDSSSNRRPATRALNALLAIASVVACGTVVIQNEPFFSSWWTQGQSLGNRAGAEGSFDIAIGMIGLVIVLEATRRVMGWTLPILSFLFLLYAWQGSLLPNWLLPHRGYSIERIVSQTFLHSQGVFGVALKVMFTYVFLFVVFGAILEATGATRYIIDLAGRLFRNTTGGPAKVAVLSSGLMGSLSGSAVANTATTGTFTIPMMKSAGFPAHQAAGLEAAASSGGALVPPIMGAGAYMMLEIIDPPVTYLQIIRAAILPAILYYLSIFLIVHFKTRQVTDSVAAPSVSEDGVKSRGWQWEGVVFFVGLCSLVVFIIAGQSVFRAVSLAMIVVLVTSAVNGRTRIDPGELIEAFKKASRGGVALIAAASCVGVIIGVVTLTGIGTRLPALILPLAQHHLLLALGALMVSSIILGMGLPSAVCYLLLATIVGPVLGKLGVAPLAAHMFIFYFGLMSMVTPPVALAAYAASSLAGSKFLQSSFAAFRFALVGLLLPYIFIYRPELLMIDSTGATAAPFRIVLAFVTGVVGLFPFAAAIAGRLKGTLTMGVRALLLIAALAILFPGPQQVQIAPGLSGIALVGLALFGAVLWRQRFVSTDGL